MQSNVKPCNSFEFSHISSLPATTVSNFCHYLLDDQLYAKEVYFCGFVTKCNQATSKYSPDVFKSFYRTVTYGELHQIFTSPPLKRNFPTFHYRTSSFCCLPIFFIKKLQAPSKIFNISWQAFSHVIFPLQTKFPFLSPIFSPTLELPLKGTYSFNRPCCPSFNRIRALKDLFINNLLFRWSAHFFVLKHPN